MEEKLLYGEPVKNNIISKIKYDIEELKNKNIIPSAIIIRVGNDKSSEAYERSATKNLISLGVKVNSLYFEENINQNTLKKEIKRLNDDMSVHGIMLLKPLPRHVNEEVINNCICSEKDIDGITDVNIAKLFADNFSGLVPCTAKAVMKLIEYYNISLEGKKVVVIGRSLVIGKPVAMLLLNKNASVFIVHSKSKDIKAITNEADILVSAMGKAKFIDSSYVKKDSVVIDVGVNFIDGKMTGDVDLEDVIDKVRYITPVPKGVGSVTSACLVENVVEACKNICNKYN